MLTEYRKVSKVRNKNPLFQGFFPLLKNVSHGAFVNFSYFMDFSMHNYSLKWHKSHIPSNTEEEP